MLRHLLRLSLAQRTITIRVDYLVRVISLLLLIGILTSCIPEEDAAAPVGSTSDGNVLRVGDVQILWGETSTTNVTFTAPFSETPKVTATPISIGGSALTINMVSANQSGFTLSSLISPQGHHTVYWQAMGKYK